MLLKPIRKALKELTPPLDLDEFELQFFRNVNIASTDKNYQDGWDEDALESAVAGSAALGNRNRWAVIAMDGNDAGQQHQKAQTLVTDENLSESDRWSEKDRSEWITQMCIRDRGKQHR